MNNNIKRGKPKKWSDEELMQLALEIKYKQLNIKLTSLLLEKETGIGRNTWSRRMKDFINQLNSPVHIPKLDESGIITIPNVEELFLKYGANTVELKNEIAKYLNIISDLYTDVKQLESTKLSTQELQLEINQLKEQIASITTQKNHFEALYNQIIAESYYPHLYGRSETLKQANVKGQIIPLPVQKKHTLELDKPYNIFEMEHTCKNESEQKIKKLNKIFNLDIE